MQRLLVGLPIGLIVGLGGLLILSYTQPVNSPKLHYSSYVPPSSSVPMPASVVTQQRIQRSYGLPVRLQIRHLKIDAKVLYMGATKLGKMEVPSNVTDVGWYKFGALPGNQGTAVIAGHLDGLKAEPGVFSNLSKVQIGDDVSVVDNAGATASFRVSSMKSYSDNEQPTEVFSSTTGSHLNLITCSGAWDKSAHHFKQRLVIFTDRI